MTENAARGRRRLVRPPTMEQKALQLLRQSIGAPGARFRDGQWEAIQALVQRRGRMLVVQRTGWGKSAVYFIATRLLRDRGRGPTLIISPLLSLMRNQVEAAGRLGLRAVTINCTNTDEWPALVREVVVGGADALLISPERLANGEFLRKTLMPIASDIGMVVIDEAHCISDWGHDFRPDYRRLVHVLKHFPPNLPVLATTATANDRVVEDVVAQLGDVQTVRGPLRRDSLALSTLRLPDESSRLAWIAEVIPRLPGAGIVYTLTQRDSEQVSDWLCQHGIKARAYHAGVKGDDDELDTNILRERLERRLLANEVKVLVATVALGMGFDKPDLGFVIHYQAPGSIVAYYQQVGRAGRAIDEAHGILLTGREDSAIHDWFRHSAFPGEGDVSAILRLLERSDGLKIHELETSLNLRRGQIAKVLKFLAAENPSPVLKDGAYWRRTAMPYQLDRARIQQITAQRESEWAEVNAYVDDPGCRMEFLSRALDDPEAGPCGRCDRCVGENSLPVAVSSARVAEAARWLRRAERPIGSRKLFTSGAFEIYEFRGRIGQDLLAEEGRVLARWKDGGWGRLVAAGKEAGHFADELVEAAAEMLEERWRPVPPPTWVTCVPSRTHPTLVPDFAARLARRVGLPFLPVVTKVRDNEPQKIQQNSFHQCANLDGAFSITPEVRSGPVLLVDDMVDSRWTFTVIAALLRQAGSGPVFPFALANTMAGG